MFLKMIKHFFYKIKLTLKGNPFFYIIICILKKRKNLLVNKETDLCLDFFPRTANTFTYVLLSYLNKDLKIAHHSHTIANLKLALKKSIPIVVVIRHPKDAVSSYVIRESIDIDYALLEYIWFHSFVLKNIDKILLFNFKFVSEYPIEFVKVLNQKFGFNFNYDYENEHIKNEVFLIIRENYSNWNRSSKLKFENSVAIPVQKRSMFKENIIKKVVSSFYYNKAEKLYKELKELMYKN